MKRLFFILLPLLLLGQDVLAQVTSPRGRFAVDYNQGCAPLTISFSDLSGNSQVSYYLNFVSQNRIQTITSGQTSASIAETGEVYLVQLAENLVPVKDSVLVKVHTPVIPDFKVFACSNFGALAEILDRTYDYYDVSFGAAAPVVANSANNFTVSHNFPSQGNYPIMVTGRYTNGPANCGSSTQTLSTRARLEPAQWSGLFWNQQADSVYLQYALEPDLQYELERLTAAGTYEKLFNLPNSSTDTTLYSQGLSNQARGYRIKTVNSCAALGNESIYSGTLYTASWTVISSESTNIVTYTAPPQFTGEVALLDASGLVVQSATSTNGQLIHENVYCGSTYCYSLVLEPADSDLPPSESAARCVVAKRTEPLPALQNIASYWLNQQLVVLPQLPDENLQVTLTLSSEAGQQLAKAQADTLAYSTTSPASCYALSYADKCGNAAVSPTSFCPMYLANSAAEPDEFAPQWNAYQGYQLGVQEYILQELDPAGTILNEWAVGNATFAAPFTSLTTADTGRRFRVKAVPAAPGLDASYSTIFRYELIMKGYFPNAFSPNGDGVNDEFKILGKFVTDASVWIYNRWGETIFFSADKEIGWQGMYSGKQLPPGPYVYKAEVTTADGQKSILTGTIFLKR